MTNDALVNLKPPAQNIGRLQKLEADIQESSPYFFM